MGKDALSLEEVAVLLGESAGDAARRSEADDLRRRLAGSGQQSTDESARLADGAGSAFSGRSLDAWPWPRQLASRLAQAWSELLRTEASVAVLHVEATTFGGFLLRTQQPAFLATATLASGTPSLAVTLPRPFMCAALRRMLGGPLEDRAEPEQGLTPLEQRLATRLVACLLPEALAVTGEGPRRPTLPLAGGSDAVAAGEGPRRPTLPPAGGSDAVAAGEGREASGCSETRQSSSPLKPPVNWAAKPESTPCDAVPVVVHDQLPHVTPTWSRTQAAVIQFRVVYGSVAGLLDCCVPWAT